MNDLRLGDVVEVKVTGQRGKVDQIRDPEPRYLILFNNDAATIVWKRTDELNLIERPKDPGAGCTISPSKPLMD